jgi:hypothetical protein
MFYPSSLSFRPQGGIPFNLDQNSTSVGISRFWVPSLAWLIKIVMNLGKAVLIATCLFDNYLFRPKIEKISLLEYLPCPFGKLRGRSSGDLRGVTEQLP